MKLQDANTYGFWVMAQPRFGQTNGIDEWMAKVMPMPLWQILGWVLKTCQDTPVPRQW